MIAIYLPVDRIQLFNFCFRHADKARSKYRALCFILILFWSFFSRFTLSAQNERPFDVAIELQAYPTGFIPGFTLAKAIGHRQSLHLRLGYNVVRHGDAGEHEDERGGGAGFTLGYRRYFKNGHRKFFVGSRIDFWFNSVDWKDNIGAENEMSGTSEIIVLQPTAEGGYLILLGQSKWFIIPKLALGVEMNLRTDGAEVGQGAILLGGVSVGKRF